MLQLTENKPVEKHFFELLGIAENATLDQLRAKYLWLCQIWHPKSLERWSKWTDQAPNKEFCEVIYASICKAFQRIAKIDFRFVSTDKACSSLSPDQLAYRQTIETKFIHLSQAVTVSQSASNWQSLVRDNWVNIATFLASEDLASLGLVATKFYPITYERRWFNVATGGNSKRLIAYLKNNSYQLIPRTLGTVFSRELTNGSREGFKRLLQLRSERFYPEIRSDFPNIPATRFQTRAAYSAYLYNHPYDLFAKSTVATPASAHSEDAQAYSQMLTGSITTFHALLLNRYETGIHQYLDSMVMTGTVIPEPFKKRANFTTASSYFEFLIQHIHDLYITLHRNPEIINEQDEHGQTLFFHAVAAAQYTCKDRLQLIVHVLLSTPGIDLTKTDKHGDTCIHKATRHCIDDIRNQFGLNDNEHIYDAIFVPFVEYAAKVGFNFCILNNDGMAVLHIAASLPSKAWPLNSLNPISTLTSTKTNIDYNQLSAAGYTALHYAIEQLHRNHIGVLLPESKFDSAAERRVLQLLLHHLHAACDRFKAFIKHAIQMKTSPESVSESRNDAEHLLTPAHGMLYINSIIRRITESINSINPAHLRLPCERKDWLDNEMILRILKKHQELGVASKLTQDHGTNDFLVGLQKAQQDPESHPAIGSLQIFIMNQSGSLAFLEIILGIFQEEAERILLEAYQSAKPYIEMSLTPATVELIFESEQKLSVDEQKKQALDKLQYAQHALEVKLLELENSPEPKMAQTLISSFNQLTANYSIKECSSLFDFLLLYQEKGGSSPMWQQSVNRNLNWQVVVTEIRKVALATVRDMLPLLYRERAVEYIDECCSYPLFNLPMTWVEKYRGTEAIRILTQLKDELRTQQQNVPASKLHINML